MVSVSVDSVRVMPRTAAVTLPIEHRIAQREHGADAETVGAGGGDQQHAGKADGERCAARAADLSLSQSAANSVANSGAEKLIAMAPASGIRLSAMRMQLCATVCVTLRPAWSRSRRVRKTSRPGARQDQQREG